MTTGTEATLGRAGDNLSKGKARGTQGPASLALGSNLQNVEFLYGILDFYRNSLLGSAVGVAEG